MEAENNLSTVDFISHPGRFDEVLEEAKVIAKSLGIDISGSDGNPGLEMEAKRFYTQKRKSVEPRSWLRSTADDGKLYTLTFYPLFTFDDVLAKIYVTLDFNKPGHRSNFLSTPVTPPPGYEHLSLDRPPSKGPGRFSGPESDFFKIREQIDQLKKERDSAAPLLNPNSSPAGSPPLSTSASQPTAWLTWQKILSMAILLVLAAVMIHRCSKWQRKQ